MAEVFTSIEDKQSLDENVVHSNLSSESQPAENGLIEEEGSKSDVVVLPTSFVTRDDPQRNLKEKMVKAGTYLISGRGGVYIPPAKIASMIQDMDLDPSNEQFQRFAWEALKKSINGLINKANVANLAFVVRELFQENLIRARGIFAMYIMRAQLNAPMFTPVYAALVAVINTKFPRNIQLLIVRLIIQFRRSFQRNNKNTCINSVRFIAHLINQDVQHEIVALQIFALLLQNPTADSIEVTINLMKEVGAKLSQINPRGVQTIFERLRRIINEANIEKRSQYMIEVLFAVRKDGFKDFPIKLPELDLVEEEDQNTHMVELDFEGSTENHLNVFQYDENYNENEERYEKIKQEILGDSDDENDENTQEEEGEDNEDQEAADGIIDKTETDLVNMRKTMYLVIQSTLDFEECAHKLMKLQMKTGQEYEFCAMLVDCCAQQRTYEKFYGLLCERFCLIKPEFLDQFVKLFKEQYDTCHRLDTVKLRCTAQLFCHLLVTDAIPWNVFECIKLTEDDTTSSSRIYAKILFLGLAEEMGLPALIQRFRDETLQPHFQGIFPKDNPKNTRFAINYFTAIGLGALTEDLREILSSISKRNVSMPLSGNAPLHHLLTQAAFAAKASRELEDNVSSHHSDSSGSSSSSRSPSPKKRHRSARRKRSSSPPKSRHHKSRKHRRRGDSS